MIASVGYPGYAGSINGVSEILDPEDLRSRSFGVRSGFARGPFGVRSGSVRGPRGVRSVSVRGPFGIRSRAVRGSFGVRSGSETAAAQKKPQPGGV